MKNATSKLALALCLALPGCAGELPPRPIISEGDFWAATPGERVVLVGDAEVFDGVLTVEPRLAGKGVLAVAVADVKGQAPFRGWCSVCGTVAARPYRDRGVAMLPLRDVRVFGLEEGGGR